MSRSALPNLLIIGAAKCGTSSLHYYLDQHPEIQMSVPKELHFFIDEEGFEARPFIGEGREKRLFGEWRTWRRGTDWYRGHFSSRFAVRGESSVAYSFPWYRGVAERAARVVPEARVIYLVRDPIERMVSHYMHHCSPGREWRPIADAFAPGRNGYYLGATLYATVIERFLDRFGDEQVMIVRQDRLLAARRQSLREIFRFLGVADDFWSQQMDLRRNRSAAHGRAYRAADRARRSRAGMYLRERLPARIRVGIERAVSARAPIVTPTVEAELRGQILDRLEPEIARLEQITGWDLAGWRRVGAQTVDSGTAIASPVGQEAGE